MISLDLFRFSFRLFALDHFSIFVNSSSVVLMLLEEIIKYVSSANLVKKFCGYSGTKSEETIAKVAGPSAEP